MNDPKKTAEPRTGYSSERVDGFIVVFVIGSLLFLAGFGIGTLFGILLAKLVATDPLAG